MRLLRFTLNLVTDILVLTLGSILLAIFGRPIVEARGDLTVDPELWDGDPGEGVDG